MRKNYNGLEWRLRFIKSRETEFEYWLAEQGAEIVTNLRDAESFKFRLGNKHGVLYKTMECNKVYNDFAYKFRRDSR